MKNAGLLLLLLVVAAISYGLGRKHGASANRPVPQTPTITDAESANTVAPPKTNTRTRANPAGEHSNPLDTSLPFAQNMSAFARGYEAAKANVDEALSRIQTLPVQERLGFITGIFSFVARNHSPADALRIYQRVPEASRPNALRALVGEWIYTRSPLDENTRYIQRDGTLGISGFRLGLEVELTSMLASSKPDAELATAWLDAFSNHSSRSEMLLSLAGSLEPNKHEALLKHIEGWTPWEKERVTRSVLGNWSEKSPKEAWDWYQANRNRFDQDFSSSILERWAGSDPDGLQGVLNNMEQPDQRKAAIEALGKALAGKNTDAAIDWANGLADAGERDIANRAVYDGAPRGIGAVLAIEQGFPMILAIVPGSPLDGSGVQPGDRILELSEANGSKQSLYGRELNTTVNLIRGEPGSELTLRLLRQNKNTGQLEEHLVPVTRGQLYLNEKEIPDRHFRQLP